MPLLQIITVATRQGRKGPGVATWFEQVARAHGGFDLEVVDLGTLALPLFDEPEHPRMRTYTHAHTKAWSAMVERADAFVFIAPEYNHHAAPSLINAIDYLVQEWAYKPAGFVSYGGISGGLRAVQSIKPMLSGLKVVPIVEAVTIPMFTAHIDETGAFAGNDKLVAAARTMLDEIVRWESALRVLRANR